MSAPATSQNMVEYLQVLLDKPATKRVAVETNFGHVDLPIGEIWFADTTGTVWVSVDIPAGWELVKKA